MPLARVVGIVHDRRGAGFRALYDKAGLPASTYPAFREALEAMREDGFMVEPGGASRLKRRIIERVLTRCERRARSDEIEPLLTLLRRFAAEAAREEARMFCDELVALADRRDRRLRSVAANCGHPRRDRRMPSSGLLGRLTSRSCPSPGASGGLVNRLQVSPAGAGSRRSGIRR